MSERKIKHVITKEMAELCYKTAKSIFPNENEIKEVAKDISNKTGMIFGSAKDYLKNFFLMIQGIKLSHDMSERDTRYYFDNINKDYGKDTLRKAITSLQLYLVADKQNHPGLQKIINEYEIKIK